MMMIHRSIGKESTLHMEDSPIVRGRKRPRKTISRFGVK